MDHHIFAWIHLSENQNPEKQLPEFYTPDRIEFVFFEIHYKRKSVSISNSSGGKCHYSPIIDKRLFLIYTSYSLIRTLQFSTAVEKCDVIYLEHQSFRIFNCYYYFVRVVIINYTSSNWWNSSYHSYSAFDHFSPSNNPSRNLICSMWNFQMSIKT